MLVYYHISDSANYPQSTIQVQRKDDNGGFAQVGSIAVSTFQFTDTNLLTNQRSWLCLIAWARLFTEAVITEIIGEERGCHPGFTFISSAPRLYGAKRVGGCSEVNFGSLQNMAAAANFFADVYEVVKLVPEGRVTSYGAIAAYLGAKGSSRMVGWAMNAAHSLPDVPAHRVVNRQGLLTGRHNFAFPEQMQLLLEAEGIQVKENQVQDFKRHFWDPADSLI